MEVLFLPVNCVCFSLDRCLAVDPLASAGCSIFLAVDDGEGNAAMDLVDGGSAGGSRETVDLFSHSLEEEEVAAAALLKEAFLSQSATASEFMLVVEQTDSL